MNFVGVDACRKGWFSVALDRQGTWKIGKVFNPKKIYPQTEAIVDNALQQFRRKDLARDDILDAIVLRDNKGLPMEIVYFYLQEP